MRKLYRRAIRIDLDAHQYVSDGCRRTSLLTMKFSRRALTFGGAEAQFHSRKTRNTVSLLQGSLK